MFTLPAIITIGLLTTVLGLLVIELYWTRSQLTSMRNHTDMLKKQYRDRMNVVRSQIQTLNGLLLLRTSELDRIKERGRLDAMLATNDQQYVPTVDSTDGFPDTLPADPFPDTIPQPF